MISPLALPRAPASLCLIGPPMCGASFVAQAIVAANPGTKTILKDFSTRPGSSVNDPSLAGASKLADEEHCVVLTVLHSGASGREFPDASLFFELWTIRQGWPPNSDGRPHGDLNGTEIILDRGGNRPVIRMRSDDGHRTYIIVPDKELVS